MSAQLFKAISEIDPDLINACEFESIRHPHKKKWIAVAACLLFLFWRVADSYRKRDCFYGFLVRHSIQCFFPGKITRFGLEHRCAAH